MIKTTAIKQPKYYLNRNGEFIIENYNFAKPFASFFPGIAAKFGIPMWVFYVNRGQAISSFGIKDKDHPILEFDAANRAWQSVSLKGFRTFIKASQNKKTIFYEPFHNANINPGFNLANRMRISMSGLAIEEENLSLGLKVTVEYFTIPNDSYAGLARSVTIKNLGKTSKNIELLDGLPQITPFGTNNFFLKHMSRTIEAWMNVENLENNAAYFKLAVDPSDRPEVVHIEEGNFYLGLDYKKERANLIKPIVDPQTVFGPATDFISPSSFLCAKKFTYPKDQLTSNKTPCAFLLLNINLAKSEEKTFYSLAGYMRSKKIFNEIIPRVTACGYLKQKEKENKQVIAELTADINTESSSNEFNLYAKQTYLDNVMRGGYPAIFRHNSRRSVIYIYSRKHGDTERDYNRFQIQPLYLSQGNGNYRDTNQNRRCDTYFNPDIGDENIITFLNLLQADGFNPLIIKTVNFNIKNIQEFKPVLKNFFKETDIPAVISLLSRPFDPGELILSIEERKIKLKASYDEFLNTLLSCAQKNQEAEHGEGFWTDHWTYNLDLIENYLSVFPEKMKEILFDKRVFTFYDDIEVVKPRHEKYVLSKGGAVRQLQSIHADNAKKEMFKKRRSAANTARAGYGEGEIYQTTLINKLLCILSNKLASLDPFGAGIEMEANKPNWFDSLNGLPALFGSSICETMELKRLSAFIKGSIEMAGIEKLSVTEEIYNFLSFLGTLLQKYLRDGAPDKDYRYWDKSNTLKEEYRQRTKLGFSGKELEIPAYEITAILNNAVKKLDTGIEKAKDKKRNLYYGYFINEVAEYRALEANFVKPLKFIQKRLPLFLGPQMHGLRIAGGLKSAKAIYEGVKKSPLFDRKLKMYKVTESLESCPEEIGRCRIFTPGWLENESIWLHMEYKYILELLKNGLCEEFYAELKNILIPFQNPKKYGRSILENSSFLVSSAFPDKNLHGNGFVARLSGSTAEFLQIWLVMNIGKAPFFLNERKELNLKFSPLLAGWLFAKKEKTYAFNFLGKVRVTYHNPKGKNTFGKDAVKPKAYAFNDKEGHPVKILSDIVPMPYAAQIRSRQINAIDVHLI